MNYVLKTSSTVDRYPSGLASVEVLKDGGVVRIRPVHPDDGPALEALHAHLSREAVYFRYFSARRMLPQRQIDAFVFVDYCDRMGFVIELLDGELIAHGCYCRRAGSDEAEVACEVRDEHWGRGLATLLLGRLVVAARQHGIARLTGLVLPANRRMRDMLRDTVFSKRLDSSSGVIKIVVELRDLESSALRMGRVRAKQIQNDSSGLDAARDA